MWESNPVRVRSRVLSDRPTPRVIAIDGPVASGKSTVGRALAERLGYLFLDTGIMYRAVTWAVLNRGLPLEDQASIEAAAAAMEVELQRSGEGGTRVRVDGVEVTTFLRSGEVERSVSLVAAIPGVRKSMVARQRRMAESGSVVVVGRDIGTVVLPGAELKLYLDASIAERARRRHGELEALGEEVSLAEVHRAMELRDQLDSTRRDSPLRAAADAIRVPTDGMSASAVVSWILTRMV